MFTGNNNQEMVVMTKEDFKQYSETLVTTIKESIEKEIREMKDLIENNYAIEQDGYLTFNGVVAMYHIKRGTLYEYLGRKKKEDKNEHPIPAYKIGGNWLFRKKELDAWVDAHAANFNREEEFEAINTQIASSHRRQPKAINF